MPNTLLGAIYYKEEILCCLCPQEMYSLAGKIKLNTYETEQLRTQQIAVTVVGVGIMN